MRRFPARLAVRTDLWPGIAILVVIQVALGVYMSKLNALFYAEFGPFYDSVSYQNTLIDMHELSSRAGPVGALFGVLPYQTVGLPWLLYAPVSPWIPPERAVGVWIQLAVSSLAILALFLYFTRVRGLTQWVAVPLAAAFSCIAAVFSFNGGMADFRMDLLAYLLYAAMMACYLIARRSKRFLHWALFGAVTGVLCLSRATVPLYLAILFTLLLPTDVLLARPAWKRTLACWTVAGATCAAVAGWFYALQFDYLTYYYRQWNPDANAHLPVSVSRQHVRFALDHVGRPLLFAALIVLVVMAIPVVRRDLFGAVRRLNWRPVWFAAVPLGYLVLSGSGLNTFVSMVAVGGILLFLFDPLSGTRPRLSAAAQTVVILAVGAAIVVTASNGVRNHSDEDVVPDWVAYQQGLSQLSRALEGELQSIRTPQQRAAGDYPTFKYAFVHSGGVNGNVLYNSLVLDSDLDPLPARRVRVGGVALEELRISAIDSTESGWRTLAGDNDTERVESLVTRVTAAADFAIVPAPGSVLTNAVYSHRFGTEIARRFHQSGAWRAVTEPIRVSDWELVMVLKNERRLSQR